MFKVVSRMSKSCLKLPVSPDVNRYFKEHSHVISNRSIPDVNSYQVIDSSEGAFRRRVKCPSHADTVSKAELRLHPSVR